MRIERDKKRVEESIKKLDDCFDDNFKQFYTERLDSAKMMLNKATEKYQNLHEFEGDDFEVETSKCNGDD